MNDSYNLNALPPGSMVQEYKIERVLGAGSFGIVYLAENIYLPETVAIKEFLPSDLAQRGEGATVLPKSSQNQEAYEWALGKFVREARILWELGRPERHPNIVRVSRFHEANGTAYMVMDFEEGESLSDKLEREGTLPESEIRAILFPLLDGIQRVHEESVWHRDIKPANILIRPDGSPVLIDFGAARHEAGGEARSIMEVFTPDYAAPEQVYVMGDLGPWTDVYGLGATIYRAIHGTPPMSASKRALGAEHITAMESGKSKYSSELLQAIDAAIALEPAARPQSVSEWRALLRGEASPARPRAGSDTVLIPGAPATRDVHVGDSQRIGDTRDQGPIERRDTSKGQPSVSGGLRSRTKWLVGIGISAIAAGVLLVVTLLNLFPKDDLPPPAVSRSGGDQSEGDKPPLSPGEEPRLEPTPPKVEDLIARLDPGKKQPPRMEEDQPPPIDREEPTPVELVEIRPVEQAKTALTERVELPFSEQKESPSFEQAEPPPIEQAALPPIKQQEPPPIDRQAIVFQANELTRTLSCADLSTTLSAGDRIRVTGYVEQPADLARLKYALAEIPGVRGVDANVDVYSRPFCEILGTLKQSANLDAASAERPWIVLSKASGDYLEGDFLQLSTTATPAYDGYLYVDFVDPDGNVLHLLPAPGRLNNFVSAGEEVLLGQERQYEIFPPHGYGMIVAISSPSMLFDRNRDQIESVGTYLGDLREKLERLPQDGSRPKAVSTYVMLTTRPRPG